MTEFKADYRPEYVYLPYSGDISLLRLDIIQWFLDNNISYAIKGGYIHFTNPEDLAYFILRWQDTDD